VSVVVLNHNGDRVLHNCLSTLLSTTYSNFEVILVDNASQDSSYQTAAKAFGSDPRLKLVKSERNLGFSGGNNIGYQHAKGDYIVFLNNDTEVEPQWLTELINAMQNDPSIGLAQSMILTIEGDKIQTAGWLFTDYFLQKHELCKNQPSSLKLQSIFEISFVCGAAMMIRREIAEKMGLFEPKLPFFYDDTLLSLKTWLSQKRVVTVSKSRIRHVGGATNVWNTKFTRYHLLKSNICLLFDTYHTPSTLSKALAINACYLFTNSIYCLTKRNNAVVAGNLKALSWALGNMRYLWQNRLKHWSNSKIKPKNLEEKFLRLKVPSSFFVLPSKLGADYFNREVDCYEKAIRTT
jgi:GT2 family glycosyltransferase